VEHKRAILALRGRITADAPQTLVLV